MALFFRILRHLLPSAIAWRIREGGTRLIELFFAGLAESFADAREHADLAYLDLFPEHTRLLERHEVEYGLTSTASEDDRRDALAAAWMAIGGQSPSYIQSVLRAAGFDVYVHEWWESGPPWVARDPRDHTVPAELGTVQCTDETTYGDLPDGTPYPQCGEPQAVCDDFLQNEPGYIQNETLARRAPPPVPEDPAFWPYFIYIGGETFPDRASVPLHRRMEFRALILKLRPMHDWIVLLVDYPAVDGGMLDFSLDEGTNTGWLGAI